MMKLVVLACVLAAATANLIAPLGYSAALGYATPLALSTPLLTPSNYRGPLSLAPGQPANIIAADGRPLDTLDVNLDRSAHLTAKALTGAGVHLLKKRSIAPLVAPVSPIGVPAPLALSSPLALSVPLALSTPLALSAPVLTPSNYRGPLSLAPGQPANIVAADGRPLDTLDVNLDRSAHILAKSLTGPAVHLLKKRSAPLLAPLAVSRLAVARTPLIAPLGHGVPTVLSSGIVAPNVLSSGIVAPNVLSSGIVAPSVLSTGIVTSPLVRSPFVRAPLVAW